MWTTAIADVRALISDGPTDKLVHRKRCFGSVNGANVIFKTFETRRISDFTKVTAPFGVYVGPTQQGTLSTVSLDSTAVGEFTLATPPSGANTVVEATYYFQWFLDTELAQFLKTTQQWLSGGEDITQVAPGLQPAATHYAGSLCYKKIATRWSMRWSEIKLLEDSPTDKNKGPVDEYLKMADQLLKDATEFRDDFYQRQGQPLAPLFGTVSGRVRSITPIR